MRNLCYVEYDTQVELFANLVYTLTSDYHNGYNICCTRNILIILKDISFFDCHENRVGALTTRLASDAALVQGVSHVKYIRYLHLNHQISKSKNFIFSLMNRYMQQKKMFLKKCRKLYTCIIIYKCKASRYM